MGEAYGQVAGTRVLRRDAPRSGARVRQGSARFDRPTRVRAPRMQVAKRRSRAADVVGLLAVVFIFALGFAVSQPAKLQALRAHLPFIAPHSTPKDEWAYGTTPYLYQKDADWADEPYAGATVGESGCGPTCLTMAYVKLTGDASYDPASMAAFSERNGYVIRGLTAWALMTDGAAQLGLSSRELPASADSVRAALAEGSVLIASVRPGDFTTSGHFIVLAGVNADGTLEIRDPNSVERSAKGWDVQRVLDQCAGLWALSA